MTRLGAAGARRRARRIARLTAGMFIPHTAVVLARQLGGRAPRAPVALQAPEGGVAPFSYEEAVSFLVSQGIDEQAVRVGSIPAASLRVIEDTVERHLPRRPLYVLHVGNFVGLSLAALSDIAMRHDPASTVMSVDPNLPVLGVDHPQGAAVALLSHFGLQRNNVVVCGYSLERAEAHTVLGSFASAEPAGEETLVSLERLGVYFDLVLIDGNHDAAYLRRELEALVRLTGEGALLALDDVSHVYKDVRRLFKEVAGDDGWPLEEVERDERVGVLRRVG